MLHDFSFTHKVIALNNGRTRRIQELSGRIKNSDKAFCYEVVDLLLYFRQSSFRDLAGRNDGEVVTDLGKFAQKALQDNYVVFTKKIFNIASRSSASSTVLPAFSIALSNVASV